MPDPDTFPQTDHPDAAGWVLGVLDPDDRGRFETHLQSCQQCQQEIAEFGPAAQLLKATLPALASMTAAEPEPPADLQARTLARVQQASSKAEWRRRSTRMIAVAAAAVIAAGAVIAFSLGRSTPALAFDIPLHAQYGGAASGLATAHHTADGWSIQLTVQHLKPLPSGSFYECWYAGPGNRPGHSDLITAGTFTVGSSGSATVQMWSAADPRSFPTMQITAEQPGNAAQHGQAILTGTVRV
jgi:anti-sigma-K factor RskA